MRRKWENRIRKQLRRREYDRLGREVARHERGGLGLEAALEKVLLEGGRGEVSPRDRVRAGRLLRQIADRDVVHLLYARFLAHTEDLAIRVTALTMIEMDDPRCLDLLLETVRDKRLGRHRTAALEMLRLWGGGGHPEVGRMTLACLVDQEEWPPLRRQAATVIECYQDRETWEAVWRALADADAGVRWGAAHALAYAHRVSQEEISAMEARLSDGETPAEEAWPVRLEALAALARWEKTQERYAPELAAELARIAESGGAGERLWADMGRYRKRRRVGEDEEVPREGRKTRRALRGRDGAVLAERLREALLGEGSFVNLWWWDRATAGRILRRHSDREAAARLWARFLALDEEEPIRDAAETLVGLRDWRVAPWLTEAARDGSRPAHQRQAVAALGKLRNAGGARELLFGLLGDGDARVRFRAVEALRKVTGVSAAEVAAMEERLADEEIPRDEWWPVRREALTALAGWRETRERYRAQLAAEVERAAGEPEAGYGERRWVENRQAEGGGG